MPSLKPERFHLQEVIAEAAAAFRDPDGDAKLTVRNEVDFVIEVTADRAQLFRVFSNLLRNAAEAGAGSACIEAQWADDRTVISITDDGPGFSERARERLFQPFAGSARDGGTGLGLVIVRDVVKAHGGDILLLDPEEGEGAAFQITLPRRRASAA